MDEHFEDIFRACFSPIVKYLRSTEHLSLHEAEDIASETFLLMFQKWDSLEHHTKAAMYKWAAVTAKNLLRNRVKKKNREPIILSWEQDLTPAQMPQEAPSDIGSAEEEYARCADRLMAAMTRDERELFTCKVLRRMSDTETAARLHISLPLLRTRWSRLRRKIAQNWDKILSQS